MQPVQHLACLNFSTLQDQEQLERGREWPLAARLTLRISILQQDTFITQHPTRSMCILILCFDKQIRTYFNVLYLGEFDSVR